MYIPASLSQLCPPFVLLNSGSARAKHKGKTLVKVRVRDWAGEAEMRLNDGHSLTVDLH